MPVNKTVSIMERVVLRRFCINAVSNFSSPSAQVMVMPAAASEPFPTQITSPVTPVVVLLVYTVTILLTYSKKSEQECDSVA